MSKKTKIIITVVSILVVLGLAAWFFVPRILIFLGTKSILPDVGESASYFTAYDVHAEDVQTVGNGHITVDIPADFEVNKEYEGGIVYRNADETASLLIMEPSDMSELNLLDADSFSETISGLQGAYSVNQIRKGFEKIGNGLPDSAYNTFKCVYLLDEDDNSFWSFNQGLAFMISATLKQTTPAYGHVEIYETDEICGFVHVQEHEDGTATGLLEIYRTDDLGTVNSMIIKNVERETIYAIMNSAEAAK